MQKNKSIEKKLYSFLAEAIRFKVTNSNINNVEIIRVELTNDNAVCNVFLNRESTNQRTLDSLNKIEAFFRSELAKEWTFRRLPRIVFKFDELNGGINNLLEKLDQIKWENEK